MLTYKKIAVIGTSHIAKQSVKTAKEAFDIFSPDIVAVELDNARLHASHSNKKEHIDLRNIFRVGIFGFLFAVVGSWAQKKLGNVVGIKPGSEMLTAVKIAKKKSIPVALIDQDIMITLRRLSKAITFKEKIRIPYDIIRSILFRKSELKRLGLEKFDLEKVPEKKLIRVLIKELKDKYPNIYNILVKERNEFMAKRLTHIMVDNPEKNIIAFVGAGHEEEIVRLIRSYEKKFKANNLSFSYSYSLNKTPAT